MTKTTNKKAVAAGLTAGLLGGAAAGMVFGLPGVTGAASSAVVQQVDEESPEEPDSGDVSDERLASAAERLREALQPLVDAGTIDASQADEVADFLVEEADGKFGRKGHMGHRGGFGNLEVIEDTLGMERAEIREALAGGSTLAELAGADAQMLIDALVADAQAKLADAVAEGKLTDEQAAERSAAIEERVTDMVNDEFERGAFEGRRGPGGWGSAGDEAAGEEG